jgi:hypothetical protein
MLRVYDNVVIIKVITVIRYRTSNTYAGSKFLLSKSVSELLDMPTINRPIMGSLVIFNVTSEIMLNSDILYD